MTNPTFKAMDSPKQRSSRLQLINLPPELRDHIWTLTLPDRRRVFHVRNCFKNPFSKDPELSLLFSTRYAPPVSLQICRDSRAAAMRQGFFLSGVWFRRDTDILHFGCQLFPIWYSISKMQPALELVRGLDKVHNIGIDWNVFFESKARPVLSRDEVQWWKGAIKNLYNYMPDLKTLNYILPGEREYQQAMRFKPFLLPLPESTTIPSDPSLGATTTAEFKELATTEIRAHLPGVAWEEVKRDLDKTLEGCGSGRRHPLRVIGWWICTDGILDVQNIRKEN